MSSRECPPRSKKFSCGPTSSTPSTSRQTSAIRRARPEMGAAALGARAGRGRAWRSTLPLGVSGRAANSTKRAGTMKSGNWARNA